MELIRIMSALMPGQNVSPDLSTYDAMIAHWRGNGVPPTLAEVNAKGAELQAEDDKIQYLKDRKADQEAQSITLESKMAALWSKIMDGDSSAADALKIELDKIKVKFPKP